MKRKPTVGRIKGLTAQEHSIRLSDHIKDRDANPITVETTFGTWSSGKGGLGWHTEWHQPLPERIASKRKYRGG
jgi:hypothetical protein